MERIKSVELRVFMGTVSVEQRGFPAKLHGLPRMSDDSDVSDMAEMNEGPPVMAVLERNWEL